MKKGVFFCDINGTYECKKNRKQELKNFIINLEHLKQKDKLDSLAFCFITTDNFVYCKEYYSEMFEALNNTGLYLDTGYFGENKVNRDGTVSKCDTSKISQVKSYINDNDDINIIYYADDLEINSQMIYGIFKKSHPNIEFKSFVPNKLDNLNLLLEEYIKDNKKSR